MWIEFITDTAVKWSPRVTQIFKKGAVFNCPHEKADELISEGVAKPSQNPDRLREPTGGLKITDDEPEAVTDGD